MTALVEAGDRGAVVELAATLIEPDRLSLAPRLRPLIACIHEEHWAAVESPGGARPGA